MTIVSASAPGKVLISGEYAVLDGAPAIAAAIARRVQITIARASGQCHTVTTPADAHVHAEFQAQDDGFRWLAGGDRFEIVEHIWQAASVTPPHALAITVDTGEFFDPVSRVKFGLGSSAALVTALTAALFAVAEDSTEVFATALAAHRSFQHGSGSGVDVACSATGGVLRYCIDEPQPQRLQWPDGLTAALLWSGVPTSTTAKLDLFGRQLPMQSREALSRAAAEVAVAWVQGSAAAIITALRAYTDVLQTFSVEHGLGIFDAGHAELVRTGDDDVVYKPCGAGGGDVGIALAADAEALAAFVERATAANFVQLDTSIEPYGFQVSREDS